MNLTRIVTGISACIVITLACFFAFSGGSSASQNVSVNLNGTWHQSSNDTSPVDMTADVVDGHIEIFMASSVVDGLYWSGTFVSDINSNPATVVSVADKDELSQDPTKTFTYKNGELSYSFTMLGVTDTIHLSRGE